MDEQNNKKSEYDSMTIEELKRELAIKLRLLCGNEYVGEEASEIFESIIRDIRD